MKRQACETIWSTQASRAFRKAIGDREREEARPRRTLDTRLKNSNSTPHSWRGHRKLGTTESLYLKCAFERGGEGRLDEGQMGSREATWKVMPKFRVRQWGFA